MTEPAPPDPTASDVAPAAATPQAHGAQHAWIDACLILDGETTVVTGWAGQPLDSSQVTLHVDGQAHYWPQYQPAPT